jgi:hypothetical protein
MSFFNVSAETRSCSGIADAISLKKISNCALSNTSKFPDFFQFYIWVRLCCILDLSIVLSL